jgi:6-pyruvoyl-tetrahydropterin synthase
LGLLVAALAARLPGAEVTAVDIDQGRRPVVQSLGARFASPKQAPGDADIVFHASVTAAGLNTAINCAGSRHDRGDELVWRQGGERRARRGVPKPPPEAPLLAGGTGGRQSAAALGLRPQDRGRHALLAAPALDRLVAEEIAFEDAPRELPRILRADPQGPRACHPLSANLTRRRYRMYGVEVRDRIMIAHSLPDPFFGPAQNMHGATFVVDVAFFRATLTRHNVVVDIGAALDVLNKTLKPLSYQNLDALPQFKGTLTTTEFLCRYVFDAMARRRKAVRWARTARASPRSASSCTRPTWRAPGSRGRCGREVRHRFAQCAKRCHPGLYARGSTYPLSPARLRTGWIPVTSTG